MISPLDCGLIVDLTDDRSGVAHAKVSAVAELIGLSFVSRGDAGLTFAELIHDRFRGALNADSDLVVTIDGDGHQLEE